MLEDDVYRYQLFQDTKVSVNILKQLSFHQGSYCILLTMSEYDVIKTKINNIVDVEQINITFTFKMILQNYFIYLRYYWYTQFLLNRFKTWSNISIFVNEQEKKIEQAVLPRNQEQFTVDLQFYNPKELKISIEKRQGFQVAYCGMTKMKISVVNKSTKPDCHYGCQDCDNKLKICKKCVEGRNYNSGDCLCGFGYSDIYFNPVCQQTPIRCPLGCKQCNINSGICNDCDINLKRQLINNKCQCMDGYYEDNQTSLECKQCDKSCSKCIKKSNKCLSCIDSNKIIQDEEKGICVCKDTFYLKDDKCIKCMNGCIKCIDSSTCNTCNSSQNFTLNIQNQQCVCKDGFELNSNGCVCKKGSYEDKGECKKCNDTCSSCADATSCIECAIPETYLTSNGICLCKKPDEYIDKLKIKCSKCKETCQTCSDNQSCDSCFTDKNFYLDSKTKDCKCNSGYFLLNNLCEKCFQMCETCTDFKVCSTCKYNDTSISNDISFNNSNKNFFDESNNNLNQSNNNQNSNSNNNQINNLNSNSNNKDLNNIQTNLNSLGNEPQNNNLNKKSKSYSQMDNKATNYYLGLYKNSNCICAKGSYFDLKQEKCQKCPSKCSQCFQNDESQVICFECMNPQTQFIYDFNQMCKCQDGFYEDKNDPNQCIPCSELCQTCEGLDQCTKCKYQSLVINEGKCICKEGQFYDSQSFSCKNCLQNCKSCNNDKTCISCLDDQIYFLDSNFQCQCQQGYFPSLLEETIEEDLIQKPDNQISSKPIGMKCLPCNYMCSSCETKQICNKCKFELTDFTLKKDTCECSKGKIFDLATNKCQDCPSGCSECDDQKYCLKCFQSGDEQIYEKKDGKCVCSDGYFLNQDKACQKCDYLCKTCEDANSCTTCKFSDTELKPRKSRSNTPFSNSLEKASNMLCQCSNKRKYFSINKCYDCLPSCGSCDNGTTCKTCLNDKYNFDEQLNKCECKKGFYWYEKEKICTSCTQHYILLDKCVDECPPGLSVYNQKDCVVNCPQGYVSINSVCKNTFCDENCKICNKDKIYCDACNSDYFLMADFYCKPCDIINEYYDSSKKACVACHPACSGCLGTTSLDCKECKFAANPFSNYSCVLQCSEDQYIKQDPEDPRQAICSTCYKYNDIKCHDSCDKREYSEKHFYCKKCHSSCQECNGPLETDCKTCEENYFLQESGVCTRCEFGKYFDKIDNICKSCHFNCEVCTGDKETDCQVCNYTLIKSPYTSTCITKQEYAKENEQFKVFEQYGCKILINKIPIRKYINQAINILIDSQ